MSELVDFFRGASADTLVCSRCNVSKNDVLFAVTDGCFDLDSVMKCVHFCDGSCAVNNPSGRGCLENVQAILDAYVPVFKMMLEAKADHSEEYEVCSSVSCPGSCGSCSCGCGAKDRD
ncbi:MAG: hypothetical protein RR272_00035 [Synergistaceae bacterium]